MESTQYSRKLDGQGRIMLPIRLREELGLKTGVEYAFYLHEEKGSKYLCIRCSDDLGIALRNAKALLEENGYTVEEK